LFDSYHQPVARDHRVTVALLSAAFVFVPALVLISEPSTYWPAIGASAVCVVLAFFHSRSAQTALIAPAASVTPIKDRKAAK
jgi:hypothetical protein